MRLTRRHIAILHAIAEADEPITVREVMENSHEVNKGMAMRRLRFLYAHDFVDRQRPVANGEYRFTLAGEGDGDD